MKLFRYVPCFGILWLLYNIVAFIPDTSKGFAANISLVTIPMPHGGAPVQLSVSEVFAVLGIICFYFEVLKATRSSPDTLVDHLLSVGVLMACVVEFLVSARAATSSFLILTLFALVDVISGFTISLATSRRDINIGDRG